MIQLLTLRESARKWGVSNPYVNSEYDYLTAYRTNVVPDNNGNWPELEDDE